MANNSSGNGLKTNKLMVPYTTTKNKPNTTSVNSIMELLKEKESSVMLVVVFMKEKLKKVNVMDMDVTNTLMETYMKVNGLQTTNKEKVNSHMPVKKMVKVVTFTMDNS